MTLLDVSDLTVDFRRGWRTPPFRAVDAISLNLDAGRTLGIVGESGSGKTTIGRAILGLTPIAAGRVEFSGHDITSASRGQRRQLAHEIQAIFQDPYSSLNPVRTIRQSLADGLVNEALGRAEIDARIETALARVGLPSDAAQRYPAQFSGGQRQRIAVARALIASPRLVVCDEPTSALDLSVQAQVLNLLVELQRNLQLSYLFISHDLSIVRYISHEILVLYGGRIMESGPAARVYHQPAHPYTQSLLSAEPVPDPTVQAARRAERSRRPARASLATATIGAGCIFSSRCPYVIERCIAERPPLQSAIGGGRVACHRSAELMTNGASSSRETDPASAP